MQSLLNGYRQFGQFKSKCIHQIITERRCLKHAWCRQGDKRSREKTQSDKNPQNRS